MSMAMISTKPSIGMRDEGIDLEESTTRSRTIPPSIGMFYNGNTELLTLEQQKFFSGEIGKPDPAFYSRSR